VHPNAFMLLPVAHETEASGPTIKLAHLDGHDPLNGQPAKRYAAPDLLHLLPSAQTGTVIDLCWKCHLAGDKFISSMVQ
jgi:hypothetical protein